MIKCNINLIILVLDEKSNGYKVVSLDKHNMLYPNINIVPNMDLDMCLDHILEQHIKTEQPAHPFKLTDTLLADNLDIYYIVFVTYRTTIKDGFLLDIKTLPLSNFPNNAKKIISLL